MLKTFLINTTKILIAATLIYWLISSGKLDFKLLAKLQDHPWSVLISISLMVFNIFLISYRWESILLARSKTKIPLFGLVKINWIGQFFSSVLPGSVTGDLVKIIYIQKFDVNFSKKFVFASILIDRLMGLSGLILLVGVNSLLFGQMITAKSPAMAPLLNMNYALMGIVIVSFGFFYLFHHLVRKLLLKFQVMAYPHVFEKIISLWDDLVLIRSKMVKAIALSILGQFISVLTFWSLIAAFVENQMSFVQALAFIPIGLMTLALPIAPSGLGVGHAIFQKLFELSSIQNGASLFNLYFVVSLLINILGVIPYMTTKSKNFNT